MTSKEIIKKYLIDNGFDGLFTSGECGCELSDLIPCDGNGSLCEPGYKTIPTENDEGYGEFDFMIGPKKGGDDERT